MSVFPVVIWVILAVVLGIIEGATVALVSIWMAISAIIAAVIAACGGTIMLQMLAFICSSALLLLLTFPLTKKFRHKEMEKTNADRLIGSMGMVTEDFNSIEGKGKIKVDGQVWSALYFGEEPLKIGEKVIVSDIKGVRAVVEKVKS